MFRVEEEDTEYLQEETNAWLFHDDHLLPPLQPWHLMHVQTHFKCCLMLQVIHLYCTCTTSCRRPGLRRHWSQHCGRWTETALLSPSTPPLLFGSLPPTDTAASPSSQPRPPPFPWWPPLPRRLSLTQKHKIKTFSSVANVSKTRNAGQTQRFKGCSSSNIH